VNLIPRLRAVQPQLICILMTAGIDGSTAIAALRNRTYEYFDKSWDPNALFAMLDRCFDRAAMQHDHAAHEALQSAKEEWWRAKGLARKPMLLKIGWPRLILPQSTRGEIRLILT
jgi:DNA-binding NtrC family response regulator